MKTNRFPEAAIGVVLLVLCMPLLFWHCDRHENIVGKYQAVDAGRQGKSSATLDFQADGKGMWSTETDNAPFRWKVHQKAIRLHTQTGGIIEGVIDDAHIRIDMPGTGVIIFERLQ